MGKHGKRDHRIPLWLTDEEYALVQARMEESGVSNMSSYLRKMAIDGYVITVDIPELKELISLLRRSSNNLNQLTRRVHETHRFYDADLVELKQSQEKLWDATSQIVKKLSALL